MQHPFSDYIIKMSDPRFDDTFNAWAPRFVGYYSQHFNSQYGVNKSIFEIQFDFLSEPKTSLDIINPEQFIKRQLKKKIKQLTATFGTVLNFMCVDTSIILPGDLEALLAEMNLKNVEKNAKLSSKTAFYLTVQVSSELLDYCIPDVYLIYLDVSA